MHCRASILTSFLFPIEYDLAKIKAKNKQNLFAIYFVQIRSN